MRSGADDPRIADSGEGAGFEVLVEVLVVVRDGLSGPSVHGEVVVVVTEKRETKRDREGGRERSEG